MKVVLFTNNTSDGGGKAAYRLHRALENLNVECVMLVRYKCVADSSVVNVRTNLSARILRQLDILKWGPKNLYNFDRQFININDIRKYILNSDVICLHSIQTFISTSLIRDIYNISKKPIVWTPMDVEPLTGGCHFSGQCKEFTKKCGNCLQLKRCKQVDISRRIWEKKKENLQDVPITFVAASNWVAGAIKASSLHGHRQIKQIPLSADRLIFKRVDKKIARGILSLPEDGKIILFGCLNYDDKRKGTAYLHEAIQRLYRKICAAGDDMADRTMLVTFGGRIDNKFSGIPFKHIHLGELRDDRIVALAYQAADVLACPSIDDFGPAMVTEAFMCGLPVVAFDQGVAPDLIKEVGSGYVAKMLDVDDFSAGILRCLYNKAGHESGSECAKSLQEACTPQFQAGQYHALFKELLS